MLRAMDRFHPAPHRERRHKFPCQWGRTRRAEARCGEPGSWAEWLYFNGLSGRRVRFYLTFWPAPGLGRQRRAIRAAALERDGETTKYSATGTVDDADLSTRAPDIDHRRQQRAPRRATALSHLPRRAPEGGQTALRWRGHCRRRAGRSMPPAEIHGARGWLSGYVVPVLSGSFTGALHAGGDKVSSRHYRVSRSQLGILGRRALAVGSGRTRRRVDRDGRVFPPAVSPIPTAFPVFSV